MPVDGDALRAAPAETAGEHGPGVHGPVTEPDPLRDVAMKFEEIALADDFFVSGQGGRTVVPLDER